ncbi:MAG: 3-deoxy-manno-octulosonate cytidylyltransferase [Bacteroidota bacterium]
MKAVAIIPARYASSRFPAKALTMIRGKSMIRRVYEQACQVKGLSEVIVATDDHRIFEHLEAAAARVVMTRRDHRSGTDRCAEVAAQLPNTDIILNIQGDEPYIQPAQIERLLHQLIHNEAASIATLAQPIHKLEDITNTNVVKLVKSSHDQALYFSRHPIPFRRDVELANWSGQYLRHIGLYGFRRATLLAISKLPSSSLEQAEALEQLRWLENGYSISVALSEHQSISIDTPEDLRRLEDWLDQQDSLSSSQ